MKRFIMMISITIVSILSGCHAPGYNAATKDLTSRADENPNYIEDIIKDYGLTQIFYEQDLYFTDLVFIEPTNFYDDIPDPHIGFHVIMGEIDSGERIILYIPQYEDFPIYQTDFPFLTPSELSLEIDDYNDNNTVKIRRNDFCYNHEEFRIAYQISTLNDETVDVLDPSPMFEMMFCIGTYNSYQIGMSEVYLVNTGENEYVLIANADSVSERGYLILHTFTVQSEE